MKKLFEIIAGFGFMTMLFGGMMMNEPNLLAFLLAFGGVGIFAGCEYIVDWLEWTERGTGNDRLYDDNLCSVK